MQALLNLSKIEEGLKVFIEGAGALSRSAHLAFVHSACDCWSCGRLLVRSHHTPSAGKHCAPPPPPLPSLMHRRYYTRRNRPFSPKCSRARSWNTSSGQPLCFQEAQTSSQELTSISSSRLFILEPRTRFHLFRRSSAAHRTATASAQALPRISYTFHFFELSYSFYLFALAARPQRRLFCSLM